MLLCVCECVFIYHLYPTVCKPGHSTVNTSHNGLKRNMKTHLAVGGDAYSQGVSESINSGGSLLV